MDNNRDTGGIKKTMTNTVNNGTTSLQVDTTNMNITSYQVQVDYNGNNTYNNNTHQSLLHINNPNLVHIDVNNNTQWIHKDDSGRLINTSVPTDSNGYITNTINYFTICTQPVTRNMKLTATLKTNNNNNQGWGIGEMIDGTTNCYWIYTGTNATLEEAHNRTNKNNVSINKMTSNTDYHLTYTIDNNGYITYTDDNNTTPITSNRPFTDEELNTMFFRFKHWNASGRIICKQLTYEYNIQQGE